MNFPCSALAVLLLSFGLAASVQADESAKALALALEQTPCNASVRYETNPYISKAYTDLDGSNHIVLDPSLREPDQIFHRLFLIAHECAHHELEHTSKAGLARRNTARHGVRDQELSADCWAAEHMTRLGYMKQTLSLADEFWRRGFMPPGQGYPAGIQRSNIIRHCASREAGRIDQEESLVQKEADDTEAAQ